MHQRFALVLAGAMVTWMAVTVVTLARIQTSYHSREHIQELSALPNVNRSLVSAQVNGSFLALPDKSGIWLTATAEPSSYVYDGNCGEIIESQSTTIFGWNAPTLRSSIIDALGFSVSESTGLPTQPQFNPPKTVIRELPQNATSSTTIPAPIDVAMTTATDRSGQSVSRLSLANHPEETLGESQNVLASFSRIRALHLPRPLHGPTGTSTTGLTTCGGCPWTCSETVKRSVAYVYSNPAKTAWASTGLSCRA